MQQAQRNTGIYPLDAAQVSGMKQRMLDRAERSGILLFLDNNNYPSLHSSYECLLAFDAYQTIFAADLQALQQLHDEHKDWLFGHICYDHKNELEPKLTSRHDIKLGFPQLYFFIPRTVCYIDRARTSLTIATFDDPQQIYNEMMAGKEHEVADLPKLTFTRTVGQQQYLDTIAKLRQHIADGDCYEINYCTEGHCEDVDVVPMDVFRKLNELSPAPFAAYYRLGDRYMMCASPERYLRKEGDKLLSQPIKGTARRDADVQKDQQIKEALRNDIKERAENVMIVDLVRNDLARCCEVGSVRVDELFGIYTYPQVHQMISTVSGTMRQDMDIAGAIACSFPMGSMTGAPKHKVMQLIDTYEHSRRELFAGTVGYITPNGDMDMNVVIRSLFYNATTRYLSYQTGGAITYDSIAGNEWEEMLLKAWALERIFQ